MANKPRDIEPDGTEETVIKVNCKPGAPLPSKIPEANDVQNKSLGDHVADEQDFQLTKTRTGNTAKTIISWSQGRLPSHPMTQNGLPNIETPSVRGREGSEKGPFAQIGNAENQGFQMKDSESPEVAPTPAVSGTPGMQLTSQPSPETLLTRACPWGATDTMDTRLTVSNTEKYTKDEAVVSEGQVPGSWKSKNGKQENGQEIISTVGRAQMQIQGAFQQDTKLGSAFGIPGQPEAPVRKNRGQKRDIRDSTIASADEVHRGFLSEKALGKLPAHQPVLENSMTEGESFEYANVGLRWFPSLTKMNSGAMFGAAKADKVTAAQPTKKPKVCGPQIMDSALEESTTPVQAAQAVPCLDSDVASCVEALDFPATRKTPVVDNQRESLSTENEPVQVPSGPALSSIANPDETRLPPGASNHVSILDLASPALQHKLCEATQESASSSLTPRLVRCCWHHSLKNYRR